MLSILFSILFSFFVFDSSNAFAYISNAKMPVCLHGGDEMQIDNARILRFKTETKNQYHDRGFVQGKVTVAPYVENGHDHFAISIGPGEKDTLEIVYNFDREFGPMPSGVKIGDVVTVCGDYITSNARGGGYDASPEGALIHWTHWNPATRRGSLRHEHGFLMIGSNLVGFDEAPEQSWDGTIVQPLNDQKTHDGGYSKPKKKKKKHFDRMMGDELVCRTLAECSARNAM